jgi:hypothetical protein
MEIPHHDDGGGAAAFVVALWISQQQEAYKLRGGSPLRLKLRFQSGAEIRRLVRIGG